jgi:hypothetical protein
MQQRVNGSRSFPNALRTKTFVTRVSGKLSNVFSFGESRRTACEWDSTKKSIKIIDEIIEKRIILTANC